MKAFTWTYSPRLVQEYFIIIEKNREYEITGLGKKVVWVFPKRNGTIIGWLVDIPRSDCKIPLDGWLSGGWWSNSCLVKCLG